jgi:pimeloyl-ACP methyl ester carboxylesterase
MYQAFSRVIDACMLDDECSRAYPQIEQVLIQLVDSLNQEQGSIQYQGDPLLFDGGDFMDAIYNYPKSHAAHQLPIAILQASQGDYSYVEPILPYVLGVIPSDTIAGGVQKSMFCREEIPYETYARLQELNRSIPTPYSFTFETDFYWRMCEIWGVDPAEPYVNEAVFSDVPTLVLAGLYDPITPIEWSRLAAESLTHSYYYEFPGGHGILRTYDCGRNIGLQFLDDPWSEPDASCLEHMKPPDFE